MRVVIQSPTAQDVLCGKDKSFIRAPGNVLFREMVGTYLERYNKAVTKKDKMNVTKEVVERMKSTHGSRFIKPNGDAVWQELTELQARDKVSHALRFLQKTLGIPGGFEKKAPKPIEKKTTKPTRKRARRVSNDSTTAAPMSSSGAIAVFPSPSPALLSNPAILCSSDMEPIALSPPKFEQRQQSLFFSNLEPLDLSRATSSALVDCLASERDLLGSLLFDDDIQPLHHQHECGILEDWNNDDIAAILSM